MARKTSSSPIVTRLLPWLVATYIRLVHRTVRWRVVGEENHLRLIERGTPFICTFWHSRLLMMPVLQKQQKRRFTMLISEHKDGEVIARVMEHFGIDTRRGSAADPRKPEKNKGGAAALKSLVPALRDGSNIGITPDGPRGPRQRAQAGVAQLARLGGAAVLPVTFSAQKARVFDSWDHFLLPLPIPFAKGIIIFGDPIELTEGRKTDAETLRLRIEEDMNAITRAADREMGRETPAPETMIRLEKAEAP
ncbi:MAG: lysophospholipid acyltransferase family protein [Pseudomonadota bacterium]